MTGPMDGPRTLTQYSDMKTAAQFISDRLEAHKAGCRDITQDPLVQAAMEARRQTAEVMAHWNDRREATVPHTPERRVARGSRRLIKRQAG